MRKRIYEIIEQAKESDRISFVYDCVMLVAIVASIIPLMFTTDYPVFKVIEIIRIFPLVNIATHTASLALPSCEYRG